jgi:2-alkyl-3-oxoalkanoate reductase
MALGAMAEGAWSVLGRTDTPPFTRFLVEQLTTAHWFDQRRTQALLGWAPRVRLDEGFEELAKYQLSGDGARSVGGSRVAV